MRSLTIQNSEFKILNFEFGISLQPNNIAPYK
jgi:hypothetical protein